jgi:hypothetical protein
MLKFVLRVSAEHETGRDEPPSRPVCSTIADYTVKSFDSVSHLDARCLFAHRVTSSSLGRREGAILFHFTHTAVLYPARCNPHQNSFWVRVSAHAERDTHTWRLWKLIRLGIEHVYHTGEGVGNNGFQRKIEIISFRLTSTEKESDAASVKTNGFADRIGIWYTESQSLSILYRSRLASHDWGVSISTHYPIMQLTLLNHISGVPEHIEPQSTLYSRVSTR